MKKNTLTLALVLFVTVGVSNAADTRSAVTSGTGARDQQYRELSTQLRLFGQIFNDVYTNYVDTLNAQDFMRAGIEGMLGTLDPYTVYFKPDDTDEIKTLTTGEYAGIGIEIGLKGDARDLTVIAPIDDTPAARKGLRTGDAITHINGESTAGFTTSDAADHIRGPEGTPVTLTIRRVGFDKPLEYVMNREIIRIHDVAFSGMIENDIGYIKLVRFSGQAGDELHNALRDLLVKKPKGLVLDMRYNPGGLLPDAIQIASEFLQPGDMVVSTRGRAPRSTQEFRVEGEALPGIKNLPVAVLVNGGSASASEIVSGAIQDQDRGVVLGTESFGKGLVQTVSNLPAQSMLKITTARYYTPSGRCIQRDRKKNGDEYGDGAELVDGELVPALAKPTDSTTATTPKFFTKNGREVHGGGGVTPDITLDLPYLHPGVVEMIRNDYFYTFIQDWINNHGKPETYDVSPDMMTQFEQYLQVKKYNPPVAGTKQIDQLRQYAIKDTLSPEVITLLDSLNSKLTLHARLINADLREEIRQNLEREIASAIGGREARIRASFGYDTQLTEAVKIVRDPKRYKSLLSKPPQATVGK